jgi:hypothetical protein
LKLRIILIWGSVLTVWGTVGALSCLAQYPDDFHRYLFEGGVGYTGVRGSDAQNFNSFRFYQIGGGVAWKGEKPEEHFTNAQNPDYRHWNVYVTGQFLWGEPSLKEPVSAVINSNPQNPSLLGATSGTGRFYSTTAGPRIQYSKSIFSIYGQVAGGWLRRSIDLTGPVSEGTTLQPTNPSVFGQSGNSGVLRLNAGVAAGAKGIRGFVELGLLQGFAINHGTMLAPMISGGARW